MAIFRFILYAVIIYFVYNLVKNLLKPGEKKKSSTKVTSSPKKDVAPPPYDPKSIEDIDYEEVKRKKE